MQVCTSLQTDNHTSTPPLCFTGRMPFLPPNQQRQSTEGNQSRSQSINQLINQALMSIDDNVAKVKKSYRWFGTYVGSPWQ